MSGLRERQKSRRANAILDAAQDLFRGQSLDAVSVEAIASQVEVSAVTLCNYFGSRDGLIHALGVRHHKLVEKARRPLLEDPPADSFAAMDGYIDMTFDQALGVMGRPAWRQITAVNMAPGIADDMRADLDGMVRRQIEKLIGQLIGRPIERGALRDGAQKGDLAVMVWAVIDFHFYRVIRDARLTPAKAKAKAKRQLAVLIRSHLAGELAAGDSRPA
jgi:AcrR family transcriptional regulator